MYHLWQRLHAEEPREDTPGGAHRRASVPMPSCKLLQGIALFFCRFLYLASRSPCFSVLTTKKFSQLGHLKAHIISHIRAKELPSDATPRRGLQCGSCKLEFWMRSEVEGHQAKSGSCVGAGVVSIFPNPDIRF